MRVAAHQSIARAALDLRVTPSAVSRQIKSLERQLGVPLLYRTTRSMALTEAGRNYLIAARQAFAQLEQAGAALVPPQAEVGGELRISAPVSLGRRFIVPMLPRFMALYPQLHLDLSLTDAFVDLAAEGIDLAIRVGRLEDSGLRARQLASNRRLLVASPHYLLQRGQPKSWRELQGHTCLALTINRDGEQWRLLDHQGQAHSIKPQGRLRANTGDAVLAFALAGCGIAFLSELMVHDALRDGTLLRVLPDCAGPETGVHAVFLADPALTPKLRVALDFLAEHLADTLPA